MVIGSKLILICAITRREKWKGVIIIVYFQLQSLLFVHSLERVIGIVGTVRNGHYYNRIIRKHLHTFNSK